MDETLKKFLLPGWESLLACLPEVQGLAFMGDPSHEHSIGGKNLQTKSYIWKKIPET